MKAVRGCEECGVVRTELGGRLLQALLHYGDIVYMNASIVLWKCWTLKLLT